MPSFPATSPLQSGLGAHFELLIDLTRRSCEAMRKLSELHLQFAQQMLQDSAEASRSMLHCSDVFQLAAVAASAGAPAAQHLHQYQSALFSLMNGVQQDLQRGAQALSPEAGSYAGALIASARSAAGNGAVYKPRHP